MGERKLLYQTIEKVVDLKNQFQNNENLVILTSKGVDLAALEVFASYGILALRRVKKRNIERISKCTGCNILNVLNDLTMEDLGFAESVYEKKVKEDKYTFIEGVKNPKSCTILYEGPNPVLL